MKAQLEHQVQQEIVAAIGEIMDKYNLVMCVSSHIQLLYSGESITKWKLSANQYDIAIETICEQLTLKDYGKVEK